MKLSTTDQTLPKGRVRHKKQLPSVLVMTDDERLPDPLTVARTIPSAWGLIFRHYSHPARAALAKETAAVCRARGVTCLIARDWRLADRSGADGVHMPEGLLRDSWCAPLKLWCRRGKHLTVSAHSNDGLRRAAAVNADAALLSPIAATASHPDRIPVGMTRFAALVRARRLKVYALGGMTLAHHRPITAFGGAGVAGISLADAFV